MRSSDKETMRYLLLILFVFVSACATRTRLPAAVAPEGALELSEALSQGVKPTLEYLKNQTTAKSFSGLTGSDPAKNIPDSLKAPRVSSVSTKVKSQQGQFLRRHRQWSSKKRASKAQELVSDFNCDKAVETQALGYSMEIDFPADEAMTAAQALHEKVLTCDIPKNESVFRLAVFAVQKGDCKRAEKYLNDFPKDIEQGASDRLTYLRSLCDEDVKVAHRNPLGGYGILLGDSGPLQGLEAPAWYLTTSSGSADWDRLLATFIELSEKGQSGTIKYIASKMNFDEFRKLPISFQTSMLVLMNFATADLPVFRAMHSYLSEHPEMLAPSVAGLLFPVRYWSEIVENSKGTDPVLVKALIRQESAFNPQARSHAKAMGLMQLIYPTARIFGVKSQKRLFDPEVNITAGAQFLGRLIEQFGSVELALAAYNAGPLKVKEWKKRYPTENINLFVEMIPYSETREYVRLVNRNYRIYQTLLIKPQILGDLNADK